MYSSRFQLFLFGAICTLRCKKERKGERGGGRKTEIVRKGGEGGRQTEGNRSRQYLAISDSTCRRR